MSTEADYAAAQAAAALCAAWQTAKTEQNLSGNQAAALIGKSPAWFSVHYPRWRSGGVAALLPKPRDIGKRRRVLPNLPTWFLPVARFYYLLSNRTHARGSVPEAIRCAISLPYCPPSVQERLAKVCADAGWTPSNGEKLPSCPDSLRESILARAKAGKPMLPESYARQIIVSSPFVKHHRSPRSASLDFISAHGTQMLFQNPKDGQETFIRSGDVVEADDATINFPCVVSWPMRGCPCSDRYGVKVARFQWLVAMDVGSRKILSFSYTARAKSQYRAEDVLSLMRCVCLQHGVPRAWRLEKGIFASNRVIEAVKLMGAARLSVHSPHAKPFIEGLFNKLWTKLSIYFPDASVGRFRGEGEDACKFLTLCQDGLRDPRQRFPILPDVISAFHAVIGEHNASQIVSANYGRWIPNERWAADMAARPLSPILPESDWLFAPFVRFWKVRGCSVGGKVPLFPGVSVPYQFQAPFLFNFHGADVKAYFDPSSERCSATLVLVQPWQNHRAGEVIGVAPQVNRTTDYIRSAMQWQASLPGDGAEQLRIAHSAMRREVRGIVGIKAVQVAHSEERYGQGNLVRVERGSEPAPDPEAVPVRPVDLSARRGKIARLPLSVRNELNVRMRDGESGPRIVAWLNALPEVQEVLSLEFQGVPLNQSNLSNWRHGGYAAWLGKEENQQAAAKL